MDFCELCGNKTEKLQEIKVSSTLMRVCSNCKNLGKQIFKDNIITYNLNKNKKVIIENFVISNFLQIIQKRMSEKKLNSHILARAVNIKESSINKILSGKLKLEIPIAKKLEKFLDIKLIDAEIGKQDFIIDKDFKMDDEQDVNNLANLIKKELKKND